MYFQVIIVYVGFSCPSQISIAVINLNNIGSTLCIAEPKIDENLVTGSFTCEGVKLSRCVVWAEGGPLYSHIGAECMFHITEVFGHILFKR